MNKKLFFKQNIQKVPNRLTQLLKELKAMRKRQIIAFAGRINDDMLKNLYTLLQIGPHYDELDLFIYTEGGGVSEARRLVLLLREYTNRLNIIAPYKAHSAGTLVCLGANNLVLTHLSELTPIDAQIKAINTEIDGAPAIISSARVRGFFRMCEEWFSISGSNNNVELLKILTEHIFPLSLSFIYDTEMMIKEIGVELLLTHRPNEKVDECKRIVENLVSGYYSHGYALTPSQIREIGLNVQFPSKEEEQCMWFMIEHMTQYLKQGILVAVD